MGHNVIKKIHIAHFRSIVNETIELDDFNVFVGKNDVGKSNILKALDMFFNYTPDKYKFRDNYSLVYNLPRNKAEEIIIELTIELPSRFVDSGEVVWTKIWRESGLHQDKFNREFKPYSRSLVFLKRIQYEYVPAVKSREYFKDLLAKLYRVMLDSSNSDLLAANATYTDVLKQMTLELTSIIEENLHIDSYLQMPNDMEILFRDLLIQTKVASKEIPLIFRGDGIQARHIPSILKFIYNKTIIDAPKNSVRGITIWGYEEPENGVELKACYELAQEFFGYSSEIQLLITTHSPAFYSLKNKVLLYYTKKENGISRYSKEKDIDKIDEELGLLPLIEPYMESIKKEIDRLNNDNLAIKEQLGYLNSKVGNIIIFTEGETDAVYLKKVLEQTELCDKIVFNPHVTKYGSGELDKLYAEISKSQDPNIKICLYDRDVKIFNNRFESTTNNVFRFNIPIPAHRCADDKISIEHYFTDDQLSTEDENGCRLFMVKEFNKQGLFIGGNSYFTPYTVYNHKEYFPLKILDGSDATSVVQKVNEFKNIALSKMKFAKYVTEKHLNYDFDLNVFTPIIDLIKEIINSIANH